MEMEDIIRKILPFTGIIILLTLVGFSLTVGQSNGETSNKIGEMAPDFTLPAVDGGTFTLSEFKEKKNVLLYFQEGIMCSACWVQEVDIEKRQKEFDAMDVEVVMITVDPVGALAQTVRQYGIKNRVLYDNELKVSRQYDVLKDSMHPGERPGHVFVLIGKDGTIKWRYSAYKPSSGSNHHSGSGSMYVAVDEIVYNIKMALQKV